MVASASEPQAAPESAQNPQNPQNPREPVVPSAGWIAALALCLALGFQAQILALPMQIARFAGAGELDYFMPVFWIGFCVAMWPAALLCRDDRLRRTLAWAALVGALASAAAAVASAGAVLVSAHLIAGAAWGVLFTGLLTIVFQHRGEGRVGEAAGIVFGAIAATAALRIAAVALGWPKAEGTATIVAWAGTIGWLGAAAYLLLAARPRRTGNG